jgi:uncharacterized protein
MGLETVLPMLRFPHAVTITFLAILPIPSALAASFNCAAARSAMEQLICGDEKLSTLDEELSVAFKQAQERSGAKMTITRWQREWLRNPDVTDCKTAACLSPLFAERLKLLNSVAPATDAAARWDGEYDRYWKGKKDKDQASLLLVGLSDNRVYASGSAVWNGPNAVDGQVNVGEIQGVGVLKGGKAVFDLQGCAATLVLEDKGLEVEDESGCGGLNVTFNGTYRRK